MPTLCNANVTRTQIFKYAFHIPRSHISIVRSRYGLLRYDMTPRPAYVALSTVGYYLANAKVIGKLEVVNSTGSVLVERSATCTAALVKDCAVAIDSCVNQTQWPCALCEICIIENDAALTSAGCTPADELKFCSARGIPDAKVFAFASTPGNGAPKDVLVMYVLRIQLPVSAHSSA